MTKLELRRCRVEDADAILAIRSHPVTRRYQPIEPGSLADLRRALAERADTPLTPDLAGKVQWTIVVDGEAVGWVSIDVRSRSHNVASLGYSIDPRYHGRGIASAAVQRVLPIVFDPDGLNIERLEAVAAVDNLASRRVMEKNGLRFEGIARGYLIIDGRRVDHAVYARLRDDPAMKENYGDANADYPGEPHDQP
jgi:RimJ/RimL family protein N-acetyltransferase